MKLLFFLIVLVSCSKQAIEEPPCDLYRGINNFYTLDSIPLMRWVGNTGRFQVADTFYTERICNPITPNGTDFKKVLESTYPKWNLICETVNFIQETYYTKNGAKINVPK